MTRAGSAVGERIMKLWRRLSPLPGGRQLFSFILGKKVPYSGTINALVQEIRPGYAQVILKDRHKVRNHLDCIHAVALLNLAELASGLALMTGTGPGVRGIIIGLSIEYYKKARGQLLAVSETILPDVRGDVEHEVTTEITDQAGDRVARCTAKWRLGLTS